MDDEKAGMELPPRTRRFLRELAGTESYRDYLAIEENLRRARLERSLMMREIFRGFLGWAGRVIRKLVRSCASLPRDRARIP